MVTVVGTLKAGISNEWTALSSQRTPWRPHMTTLTDLSRRHWLQACSAGLGAIALTSLLADDQWPSGQTHFSPRAKRIIYLFQSGAPSQMDLFDHKPNLADLRATELP